MRTEIERLVAMGRLPNESATADTITLFEQALAAIEPPLSKAEAVALIDCFGPDDCFGLAWSLVHLIETSPTPVPALEPASNAGPWEHVLYERYLNSLPDGPNNSGHKS